MPARLIFVIACLSATFLAVGEVTSLKLGTPPPTELSATWVKQDGKDAVRLSWKAPDVKAADLEYQLVYDKRRLNNWAPAETITPTAAGEYVFVPGKADRSYQFRLTARIKQDKYGPSMSATAMLLAPGRTLPPVLPVRKPFDTPKRGDDARLTWDYPDLPNLVEFQVFAQDKKIETLDRTRREWTTEKIAASPNWAVIKIVAVGKDNEISEFITYSFMLANGK
ncbi:MAG TPA: fibronectin type III domain-containing protein [Planctomycetaceae bacterium]|jgi:hypothetical protein|nr:fibronectin type III domain-containing protein [Planctomycetaceae bacterium]